MRNYFGIIRSFDWTGFFKTGFGRGVGFALLLFMVMDLLAPVQMLVAALCVTAVAFVLLWLERRKGDDAYLYIPLALSSFVFVVYSLFAIGMLAFVVAASRPAHAESLRAAPQGPPQLQLFTITSDQLDDIARRIAIAEVRRDQAEKRAAELQRELDAIKAGADKAQGDARAKSESRSTAKAAAWRCT
jgi:hypothetical protein